MKLYAVLPDQQIPHHDPRLHELVLRWLNVNQPHAIVCSGDLIDFPTLSVHHRRNPLMVADPTTALQRGIDAAHNVLAEYREAAAHHVTELYLIPGNHEERLQNYILDRAPALFGVARAGEAQSVLTVPHLLRLADMGYQWVTGKTGEWPHAAIAIGKTLAVRHGWLVRSGSGASARATLEHLGHSVIVGHTHRQAQTFRTWHDVHGNLSIHTAVEAGTLARVSGGLGYAVNPDWQPGFAVARVYDDGQFDLSLVKYVNNTLIWEGQRYIYHRKGIRTEL